MVNLQKVKNMPSTYRSSRIALILLFSKRYKIYPFWNQILGNFPRALKDFIRVFSKKNRLEVCIQNLFDNFCKTIL